MSALPVKQAELGVAAAKYHVHGRNVAVNMLPRQVQHAMLLHEFRKQLPVPSQLGACSKEGIPGALCICRARIVKDIQPGIPCNAYLAERSELDWGMMNREPFF